jgi:hypothetical protein
VAQPVVTSVAPNPAEPRQQLLLIGTGFGFVVDGFLEDSGGALHRASFTQVFDSEHVLLTVPPDIVTDADYTVVVTTLEDEISVNQAGLLHVQPISGSVSALTPVDTPDPFPLPVTGVSVQTDGLTVVRIPMDGDADDAVPLVEGTDYVIDPFNGSVVLTAPLAAGDRLYVTGYRHRFFDDETIDQFIEEAFVQVTHGRHTVTTNISAYGYRTYTEWSYVYDTLPEVEILPTVLLAKVQALWVLATDSSYDIDINADGAGIPRSERYRQILGQIQADTARFNDMAEALNIGIHRIEITTLRRVARMTGRLVPVYVEKEYDDHALPIRVLPGVDHGTDEGVEFVDPYYQSGAGYGGGFGP